MQSPAWGRFKSITGWKAEFLDAPASKRGPRQALLLSKKIPASDRRMYYLPRGPDITPQSSDRLVIFLNRLKKHVIANQGILLRVDPNIEEDQAIANMFVAEGFKALKKKWSFWNAPKFVFWLELPKSHEQLFSSLTPKMRTKIRYPHKHGVSFFQGDSHELEHFSALMAETAHYKGIGVHGRAYYQRLYASLQASDMARFFFAKHEGRYISTAMAVKYGCVAWLLYFASSRKHAALRPNHALVWEMLQWAIANGCTRFDFRGTATDDPPDPKNSGYGVYQFKKSFGPRFVRTMGYFDYVVHPLFYRMFRVAEDYCIPGLFECFAQGRKLKSHLFTR